MQPRILILLAATLASAAAWTTAPSTPRLSLALHAHRPPSTPRWAHSVKVDEFVEATLDHHNNESSTLVPTLQTTEPDYDSLTKKVLNGAILAISFGYAAYTILNIDHGMTRGWTQGEIAMRIPLDTWNTYESALAEKPIHTKTLINVVIYLLGDWLSQSVFQKRNVLDFDPIRTLRNGFIGLCFGPLVHEYYEFSDYILPVEGGLLNRVEKIVMDQTIYLTVKCSIYIMAVGLLAGEDFATVKTRVKERIGGIVTTAWRFWPLAHCITYSVIPSRHRILWINILDVFWNGILASMSNKAESPEEEAVAAAEAHLDPFVLTQEMVPLEIETTEPLFEEYSGSNSTAPVVS